MGWFEDLKNKKDPSNAKAGPFIGGPLVKTHTATAGTIVVTASSMETVKGLDVSHYQDRVDWKAAWDAGYRFAFAKATDGSGGIDAMFKTHKTDAKAAGFIFGAYHFYRFGYPAPEQMLNFMKVAGTVQSGELPHTIDVEWDRGSTKYGADSVMDAEAADDIWTASSVLAHSIGMSPMIYTNYYFWNPGVRGATFAQMPLWVPAYHTTIDKVKIPKPWTKITFWQDSESLTIGNVTEIDTNQFLGSMDDLRKLVRP